MGRDGTDAGAPTAPSTSIYQDAVEHCADGFLALDGEGLVVFVNDAYLRRSGYTREELVGTPVERLVLGGRQQDIVARLRQLCEGASHVGPTRHVTRAGVPWPVEVSASYSPSDGGRFFAFHRDLTARERTHAVIEARLELARRAVTASLDELMQATVDAAERLTGSSIGFFHFVDEDQEQLTLNAWSTRTLDGMCTAEGRGAHYPISKAGVWVDAFHARAPVAHDDYAAVPHRKGMPEGHAPVTRLLTVPILRGERVVALLGVGNKPAAYDQDDSAAVVELAAFTIDVVARKRAEEDLRASEERFRTLFEAMSQGVFYRNEDGRVGAVNPAATRMLGITQAIVGTSFAVHAWDALREDGTPLPADELPSSEALRTRDIVTRTIGLRNQITGQHGWYEATAIPFLPRGPSQPRQVCVVLDDLSPRMEAERARLEDERRRERLDKLESLGVLAGGVAHDFNNLLAAIVGHVELASDALDPGDAAADDLAAARAAAERASQICRQMLAYAGRGRFVFRPCSVDELLAVALGPGSPAARAARLELELGAPGAAVSGDPNALARVVKNLVDNAAEAIGASGGAIRVRSSRVVLDREALGATVNGEGLAPGPYVAIDVVDEGEGMDAATVGRVFEPFFTTRFIGRGLGLPEVLGIVRAHVGAMRVTSEVRRGTTVRVLLPRLASPDELAAEGASSGAAAPAPGPRAALVADDEATVRGLCCRLLDRLGYASSTVASGAETLAAVRQAGGRLAFLVLDVTMPGMACDALVAEIRRVAPALPIVLSSGFTEEALAPQLATCDADAFLQKPYDWRRLDEAVRAAIARRAGA
jgi:PAS domain S-box-containing protein